MSYRVALITGFALGLGSVSARGHDICVICTGPDATYSCVVEDGAAQPSPGARLACITTLARQGGHETCRVRTAGQTGACNGDQRRVDLTSPPLAAPPGAPLPGSDTPALVGPVAPPGAPANSPPRVDAEPGQPQNPKTVEELARQMGRKSGQQIENAGASIGEAAKKTWGCVASFFKSC